MSGLVPGAKVRLMVTLPELLLCDDIYSRPSRPVMFCSITWVTLSSRILADAPGYLDETRTERGAMVGYCCTGSCTNDSTPASIMIMAITQAKIGRSIKNLAITVTAP